MNALMESARGVDTAWCKASLHREEESKGAGDTYCAVGHMAIALANQSRLVISDDFTFMGTSENVEAYEKAKEDYSHYVTSHLDETGYADDDFDPAHGNALNDLTVEAIKRLTRVYEVIEKSAEGKILAETIMANYPERLGIVGAEWMRAEDYDELIWNFNDHEETTREDVVSMMEKAGVSFNDAVAFEDAAEDDLVADIDALVDA